MNSQTIDAVFENSVFRPLDRDAISLPSGTRVRLIVDAEIPCGDPLESLLKVFDGMTPEQIRQMEEVALEGRTRPTRGEQT